MAKTVVLTWSPLPTTKMLLEAFSASSLSANSAVHELDTTSETTLLDSLSEDGMIVCGCSLARVSHLLAPRQRTFFDATEDSFLFRTLISPKYPDYKYHKSTSPWDTELDWSAGRKYVVKPNIGYASLDTFVIHDATEQASLANLIKEPRDFVIEEFISGVFLCADVVVEGQSILITSVYQRYDYGVKETAQYHASNLYRKYADKFIEFSRDVVISCLPIQTDVRTMFNVEAKLGSDSVLRCVEINPFRACGAGPLATSLVFGRNVFELAFADELDGDFEVLGRGEREFVMCFARKEGETAADLLPPLLKDLRGKDGKERSAVEMSTIFEERDRATIGIHDARIFELTKRDDNFCKKD